MVFLQFAPCFYDLINNTISVELTRVNMVSNESGIKLMKIMKNGMYMLPEDIRPSTTNDLETSAMFF